MQEHLIAGVTSFKLCLDAGRESRNDELDQKQVEPVM
jgi:hypothetical protein